MMKFWNRFKVKLEWEHPNARKNLEPHPNPPREFGEGTRKKANGTKLMIEELHKGFPPVIYFIEIRTPQLALDQLKNLDKPC